MVIWRLAMLALAVTAVAVGPASGQEREEDNELDRFMEHVLARRDENRLARPRARQSLPGSARRPALLASAPCPARFLLGLVAAAALIGVPTTFVRKYTVTLSARPPLPRSWREASVLVVLFTGYT